MMLLKYLKSQQIRTRDLKGQTTQGRPYQPPGRDGLEDCQFKEELSCMELEISLMSTESGFERWC